MTRTSVEAALLFSGWQREVKFKRSGTGNQLPKRRGWRTQGPECWLIYQQRWSSGSRACWILIESVVLPLAFQCQLSLWTFLVREGGLLCAEVEKNFLWLLPHSHSWRLSAHWRLGTLTSWDTDLKHLRLQPPSVRSLPRCPYPSCPHCFSCRQGTAAAVGEAKLRRPDPGK